MKLLITIITALSIVLSANAKSFLAGWDFDGVSSTATSHTANWGSLFGSATLSYDHAGVNFPFNFRPDYQISGAFDSAVVGIDFIIGTDPSTGYTSFAGNDIPAIAQQGINFVGPGTVTIDWGQALANTGTVSYAKLESGSWTTETVSVNSGETSYSFSANGFGIDNIQVIETTPNLPIPFSVPVLPYIEDFYESQNGDDPVIINATPTDGYPTNFSYQWYHNEFAIPSIYGGGNSSFSIESSDIRNGTYRIEVTNDAGTTSAEFEYRVFEDADGDGLSDYRESNILGTNPNLSDTDSDGLNDYDEVITHLTDPNVSDSDSDGLNDGSELNTYNTNPLDSDSDDDGLSDGVEVSTHLTDPTDSDSDDDGFSDGEEISTHLTNPNSSDSDNDQISDLAEISTYLTDPLDVDTDDDGLNDGIEINTYSSNPLATDTSGDGFNDGFIVGEGLNPTSDFSGLRTRIIEEVKDLRPGSVMIEVSGNQATVQLQMEESSDLQTWEDTGTPATMTIPADTDTKFFRFKMAE